MLADRDRPADKFIHCEWASLPDRIPAHFDVAGKVDRWGSKAELLVLPWISILMMAGLEWVSRHPKLWNIPVAVTEHNREALRGSYIEDSLPGRAACGPLVCTAGIFQHDWPFTARRVDPRVCAERGCRNLRRYFLVRAYCEKIPLIPIAGE